MSTLDLKPIKERLAEATPGPWESQGFDNYPGDEGTPIIGTSGIGLVAYALRHNVHSSNNSVDWYDEEQCDKDAEFIAHAPEDIRALLAEVKRLQAQIDAVKALHCQDAVQPRYCAECSDFGTDQFPAGELIECPCPTLLAFHGDES